MEDATTEDVKKGNKKETRKEVRKEQKDRRSILIILAVAVVAIVAVNTFLISSTGSFLGEKIEEYKEETRPAVLQITKIDLECENCFDIDVHFNGIKSSDTTDVTDETVMTFPSSEAQELIDKYSIDKLPTMIIEGEVSKPNVAPNFDSLIKFDDETVIFNQQEPPYYDVSEKKIIGQVTLTLIEDSTCSECADLLGVLAQLRQQNVAIVNEVIIDYTSPQASSLIQKYNIDKIPSVVISAEIGVYDNVQQQLLSIGTFENDGVYVLRDATPPYLDLSTNEVVGKVNVIYLDDDSCTSCYDVTVHRNILQNLGVFIDSEETNDVNSAEGKRLVEKYGITKVPTVIISSDASVYTALTQIWATVGVVTDDGSYIFTSEDFMAREGGFTDLSQE